MRLLIACLDGLAWPLREPPPLIARCLERGAAGALHDIPSPDQFWRLNNALLWTGLSRAGLNLGLMNLPGLWPSQTIDGFMVCRNQGEHAKPNWTLPPELADDLGDYVQPRRLSAEAAQWRTPLKDTAFAEAAALARLRYEHFRRLCGSRQVEVGAIGWSALASARQLFGDEAGRAALMLAQLDRYIAWLMEEFQPQALVVAGMGYGREPGIALMLAPDQVEPGRFERDSWQELLAALVVLAGLPAPNHDQASGDLLLKGKA